ncbi:hypothetical protein AB0F85_11715 [Nocardia fluminea]|uniref:hypothetical protein n=1 Tax=Nocardia fluminea TaxID=134984 RepID=UPI0033F7A96F
MNYALPEWAGSAGSWVGGRVDQISGMTADAWAASAGWTTAAVAVGAAVFASKQVKEARRTREEQAQPNVVMFTEPNHTFWQDLELVVKNYGTTPAYDVRMSFDPKPQVSPNPSEPQAGVTDLFYPEVIPILAPWQEWRTSWDYATDRIDVEGLATRHEGKLTYKDRQGNTYTTEAVLDWDTLKGTMRMDTKSIHHVVKMLEKQNEQLKTIAQSLTRFGSENSGVWVYSADAKVESERRREENAERAIRRRGLDRMLRPDAYRDPISTPPSAEQTAVPHSTESQPPGPE